MKAIDRVAAVQSYIDKGGNSTVLERGTYTNFVAYYATLKVCKRYPAARSNQQINQITVLCVNTLDPFSIVVSLN